MKMIDLKELLAELVSKSTITAYNSSSGSRALVDSADRIPLTSNVNKIGSDFTIVSDGIKCEKAGYVLVSAQGYFTTGFTANDLIHLVIRKDSIDLSNSAYRIPGTYSCFSIPPKLAYVSAGSMLYLYTYNQTASRGNIALTNNTFLTATYV